VRLLWGSDGVTEVGARAGAMAKAGQRNAVAGRTSFGHSFCLREGERPREP
jgi:hypothetical protein